MTDSRPATGNNNGADSKEDASSTSRKIPQEGDGGAGYSVSANAAPFSESHSSKQPSGDTGHPPFMPGQFMFGSNSAAPNTTANPTPLMWSFQQQQQHMFPGICTMPPQPQLNVNIKQRAGINGAYWNAFSVIGSSRIEPFPERLHRLLGEVETTGRTDVISWVHEGRGFEIHKSEEFFRDIVPQYFKQSKLASFKRQLGLYGFQLYTPSGNKGGSGTVKGYYAHECFLKDMPELCKRMRRISINQHGTATFGKVADGKTSTKKKSPSKKKAAARKG